MNATAEHRAAALQLRRAVLEQLTLVATTYLSSEDARTELVAAMDHFEQTVGHRIPTSTVAKVGSMTCDHCVDIEAAKKIFSCPCFEE